MRFSGIGIPIIIVFHDHMFLMIDTGKECLQIDTGPWV